MKILADVNLVHSETNQIFQFWAIEYFAHKAASVGARTVGIPSRI